MAYQNSATKPLTAQVRFKDGVASRTLTGNVTCDATTENLCSWDPGGASRDVTMPAAARSDGLWFEFYNAADAAENLVIKSDTGSTLVTLGQGETGKVACTGSAWKVLLAAPAAAALPGTANTWDLLQTFTIGALIQDSGAVKFGTPGTDLVLTADGTDVIVTATGDLVFNDSVDLKIGTGKDIGIAWDGTRLNVTQAAPDSEIRWGVDGAGIDQRFYGDTASTFALWDQSRDTFALADNAKLGFGTGAGAAYDVEMTWNGTKLLVSQLTADSAIEFGVDGAGMDLVLYGDTASQYYKWDQSADAVVMTAAVSITGQGSTVVPLIPIAAPQALTGSGAITVTQYYSTWNTTGGGAGTLANGAQKGQLKKIQLIVDAGDGTLTPTSLSGGTTITFADVGDFAILCWNGTAWVAIELGNDADGVTAPVLA